MTLPLSELGLHSDVLIWQAVLLTVVSLGVGVLGGFVGLALGTMRLPVLLFLGIPAAAAAGTNIIVSTSSALVGGIHHLREGRVNMQVVVVMGAPSMAGALLGGLNSQRAPERLLILVVGLLVLWQGVELRARARAHRTGADGPGSPSGSGFGDHRDAIGSSRFVAAGAIGFAVGVLGGAVGLILGTMRLPAIIRILRVDPRVAAGTNLLIGFAMGSMGWIGHVARGQVDYPLVVLMGSTAMVGSYLGARLTGRVSLERLVATMGVALLVVGALLVWRAFRP